jgi:hypothetical protein
MRSTTTRISKPRSEMTTTLRRPRSEMTTMAGWLRTGAKRSSKTLSVPTTQYHARVCSLHIRLLLLIAQPLPYAGCH